MANEPPPQLERKTTQPIRNAAGTERRAQEGRAPAAETWEYDGEQQTPETRAEVYNNKDEQRHRYRMV